ncbi:MAG: hypothetical protein Q9222_003128, partial [Ikaeria aurantiellina]
MTATMPQSSTHLTIPTSQNTAPVLSFRCLYTHDLRRKAKRWQDGVLRFHTFNKRVMVYDEPRNFIGDTHWRESDTIQDGDELELEKGVLIQVSEIIERTETDLSGLLEKRTIKPTVGGEEPHQSDKPINQDLAAPNPAADAPYRAFERPNMAPLSQIRPKSLNALLGTPRGPTGRAALPTKSPADLRKEKENRHSFSDRPVKRPRLQGPTALELSTKSSASIEPTSAVAPRERATGLETPTVTVMSTSHRAIGSTNGLPSAPPKEALVRDQTRSSFHPLPRQRSKSRRDERQRSSLSPNLDVYATSPIEKHKASKSKTDKPGNIKPPSTKHRRHQKSLEPTEAAHLNKQIDNRPKASIRRETTEPPQDFLHDQSRPQHLLRIASRKPRKKLMYRDLLPQKAPPPSNKSLPTQNPKQSRKPQTSGAPPMSSLDDFHDAQEARLHGRLLRRREPGQSTTYQTPIHLDDDNEETVPKINDDLAQNYEPILVSSSPLFLTQSSPHKHTPPPE